MISLQTINGLLLFIAVFLISLVNHWVIVWFVGSVFIGIYLALNRIRPQGSTLLTGMAIASTVLILAAKFWLLDSYLSADESIQSFWNNLAVYLLLAVLWTLLRTTNEDHTQFQLQTAIEKVLAVHLLAFYIQYLTYLSTGVYIDLVSPFTGEESRYDSTSDSSWVIGQFRPTGFYAEPSTFAAAVLYLYAAVAVKEGIRLNIKFAFVIAALLLTFSTAAVIFSILLMLYMVGARIRSLKIWILLTVLIFGIFSMAPVLQQLAYDLFDKSLATYEYRTNLIEFVQSRTGLQYYLGLGPFGIEPELAIAAEETISGRRVASLNDSGLLVFLATQFGMTGVLLYGWFVILQSSTLRSCVLFVIISFSKIGLFHPVFVLLFAIAGSRRKWEGTSS